MRFDAIIIGSGQAGAPLSYALADRGWTVALVEREHLGGTCVNTGCTPTKTLVHSAQVAHYARNAHLWGVRAGEVTIDLPAVLARKDAIVERFREGHERSIAQRSNLRLFRGTARFTGPHAVAVGDDLLESERVFINVGTRASIPAIPGLAESGFLTNVTVMQLTGLPRHLLVLGGGYVGLEFGQIFRRFGAEVTVVHGGPQVLAREDADVAGELQKSLEAEGMHFLLNARAASVVRENDDLILTAETAAGSQQIRGSHVLVATGRRPNTDDLGLPAAGVETDASGFIRVNGRLETGVPGIWALGDVKGGPAFTHISYNDFQIVYANVVEGENRSTDERIVPYCVFTDPQLGRVGLTEREARASGRPLKIGTAPMSSVARAIERGETAGQMKLIVDAESDRILGASILGTEGGEIVQILHALMLARAPYTLLKGAIYIHPTLAEGLWNLMEAVRPVDAG